MSIELGLLIGFLLLVGNAFFVGAEFSLVAVRRSSIETKAAAGSRKARITLKAMENVSQLMAGAQLGITLCSLGLGAIAEPALAHLLEPALHSLGISDNLLHPIALSVALSLVIFLHVVLGEMVPKNIALAGPDRASLILAPMLVRVVNIMAPLVRGLNFLASSILRAFGVDPKDEVSSVFNRDGVAGLVEESHREGLLSKDEEQLLSGALEFQEQSLASIIIPLDKTVCLPAGATYGDAGDALISSGFSRFPILGTDEKPGGYVHVKDVLVTDAAKLGSPVEGTRIRPLLTFKKSSSLRSVLKAMQKTGTHMASVEAADKKLLGFVMLDDVLAELMGEQAFDMNPQDVEA